MTILENEITIAAPMAKIWDALSNVDVLEKYDPTVKTSTRISSMRNGIGSARKVDMKDGKNWFEEKCTEWKQNEALTYELTACSFPVHKLKHSYRFEQNGNQIKVMQVMEYQIKYGLLGKFLDMVMIKRKSDTGIKQFFSGLKSYTERSN
jgi:ligand-binding SRPBCC domain-containing protein